MTTIPTNQDRLAWYIEAERKILMQQAVETAEGEKLTFANLSTVRREIERLQRMINSAHRPIIRGVKLE